MGKANRQEPHWYKDAIFKTHSKPRENHKKGRGNRAILANDKGISRILFQREKVDYLWRLSTISEKIFPKIAFPFDLKPKFPDVLAKW